MNEREAERRLERELWEGGPASDPELARLERALECVRWDAEREPCQALRDGAESESALRARRAAWSAARLGLLALAGAAAGLLLWWRMGGAQAPAATGPHYLLVEQDGSERELVPGDAWTAAAAQELVVGALGRLLLEAGSELEVRRIERERHELFLRRGRVAARIDAPREVFRIGTPAAMTVDMGCVYELEVNADGDTWVGVQTGAVALSAGGWQLWVPQGASCWARRSGEPELPRWDDAPLEVDDQLAALLGDERPWKGALPWLEECEDTLSLWHLVQLAQPRARAAAYARLSELFPPPAGVERELVLGPPSEAALEAMALWRGVLEAEWWLNGSPW